MVWERESVYWERDVIGVCTMSDSASVLLPVRSEMPLFIRGGVKSTV